MSNAHSQRRTTMLRKLTLAVAAAAAISATALAPTSASAGGFFFPHHHHHHWGYGHGFGLGFVGGGGYELLRDPPRADAVRLPLADRERLLLMHQQFVLFGKPRSPKAAGVFRWRCCNAASCTPRESID
jgi:hypothetical protein